MMSAGGQDQAGGEMTYMAMGTTPRDRADSRGMQPNVAYDAANDGVPRLDSTGSRGMQPNVAYATVDDLVTYSPTQMGDDGDYAVLPAQAHRRPSDMPSYDALQNMQPGGDASTYDSVVTNYFDQVMEASER